MQRKSFVVLLPLLALLAGPPGCGCYYPHLAVGQARLLLARSSIDALLEDPKTPAELRRQLELVEETRRFAAGLGLDVGGRYTSYAAWPGDRIITTVVATPEGSLEATPFHFPIVGEAPYKGFFDLERAEREARSLQRQGMDVCLSPVSAYSTLGWLDDPVTEPMLRTGDGRLVETLLHELVHTTVFSKSQPEFNEGVANFVGQEASVRFFAEREASGASTDSEPRASPQNPNPMSPSARQRAQVRDDRLLAVALVEIRDHIRQLYDLELAGEERTTRRLALDTEARQQLASLPFEIHRANSLAEHIRLNDACLALGQAYTGDTELHVEILDGLGGDLRAFIERLEQAASAEDPRAAFFGAVADSG